MVIAKISANLSFASLKRWIKVDFLEKIIETKAKLLRL